jgi:hypothetical protein
MRRRSVGGSRVRTRTPAAATRGERTSRLSNTGRDGGSVIGPAPYRANARQQTLGLPACAGHRRLSKRSPRSPASPESPSTKSSASGTRRASSAASRPGRQRPLDHRLQALRAQRTNSRHGCSPATRRRATSRYLGDSQ